jgi:hypothetical protein
VLERPLREALLAYEDRVQERLLERYRHEQLMYAAGVGTHPPDPPKYLPTM